MPNRRIGSVFVSIGAVLMLSALLLFVFNKKEAEQAGKAAQDVLLAMQSVSIPSDVVLDEDITSEESIPVPTALTSVQIEDYWYVGYLNIPDYELELPVMDGISEEMLRIAPCLEYGSPLTDDAVIAGHNYDRHFLPLHDISIGASVRFTDMTGYVNEYQVTATAVVEPTELEAVTNGEHDLVLYTCTIGGRSRVVVYCDRI